ncbi:esterase-like activity of phytase family protein [Phaeobacter sp. B1627]|uniref:esterase-like activity of phytase family protein n=1 Tax=Phaeobacter sp. B1627 TaxID=2583809 RepID=UPI0011187A12|nr:esterase-like activity of phytase family protein [Phaeobacter sp. B1627]TNJ41427.1 esterase-like activity of phytase family protein [Phaeobacter sp. B1627]
MRSRPLFRLISLAIAALLMFYAVPWAATAVWNVSRAATNTADFIGSYRWSISAPWFGGFSGIEVTEDGTGFTAITDRAHIVEGIFLRRGDTIHDIQITRDERLADHDTQEIRGRKEDSEGLAIAANGTRYVSFENPNRVVEYTENGTRELPRPAGFNTFRFNKSFESLAVNPAVNGAEQLLLIAEKPSSQPDVSQVWVWRDTTGWEALGAYPEHDGFLPVGADFGPDGFLYVLERKFVSVGFRTRLRRFSLSGDGLTGGDILLNTALAQHDNLEGVSIWRDAAGALRATMISDDNFLWIQRTEITEYRLPE